MSNEVLIQVKNLHKSVVTSSGKIQLLNDIHLKIHSKEVIAILGASGSGKTTLLSILAGLDPEYEGSVTLFDKELKNLSEDERSQLRKKDVGFVFQSFLLIPELNALENICLPLEIAGTLNSAGIDAAKALLSQVGLSERAKHYPATLSGGEQQRVALARAIAPDPTLLFADEPTGNLDEANGLAIVDLLFALKRERQTTLVLVTHDSGLAARCDRTIRLRSGHIDA
jgi:putative ABC transport system ATP-binding protein